MYLSFSLHDQDTHLAELWYEGFIKNLFANCRSRVGPSTLLNSVEKDMKIVSKEVTGLCSKTNPSLLRKKGKEDLEKFDLELVCSYSFLLTSAVNKRTKHSRIFAFLDLRTVDLSLGTDINGRNAKAS